METKSPLTIDICVCTFQRPHVAKTLASLSKLILQPHWQIRIIVADNDETPSAQILVEATARTQNLNLTYIHVPARNISIARNACLNAATAPLIAFIDDDEIATPEWLGALIAKQQSEKADVVLGQVEAFYPFGSPRWMEMGDFHSTKPAFVNGKVITGYTCNVLLTHEIYSHTNLRFLPELGRTGGEDTVFFSAIHKAGGKIAYASRAIVTEEVVANRLSLLWLLKRSFRSGQTHGTLLLTNHSDFVSRAQEITIAATKAAFCYAIAILYVTSPIKWRRWLLRSTLHIGVVVRLLGKSEVIQYG